MRKSLTQFWEKKKKNPHTLKLGGLGQFFYLYANALRDSSDNGFFLLFFMYVDTLACIFLFRNP